MASVTYKHKKTKQTATYAMPIPRLEKSEDWERVEDTKATTKKSSSKAD